MDKSVAGQLSRYHEWTCLGLINSVEQAMATKKMHYIYCMYWMEKEGIVPRAMTPL